MYAVVFYTRKVFAYPGRFVRFITKKISTDTIQDDKFICQYPAGDRKNKERNLFSRSIIIKDKQRVTNERGDAVCRKC